MNEMFDDDIDIFICDLESDKKNNKNNSSNKFQGPHEENPKTQRTRKESDDRSKHSKKNKYIQKLREYEPKSEISSLMKIEEGVQFSQLEKRERNRLAAKQSRDRKKMYIQLMENQHKKLEDNLARTEQELMGVKKKIAKFVSENKILTGFNTLSQLENKFYRILNSKNGADNDVQINTMLDSMRFRLGATGKQRVRKVNDFYKQIINLSLPPLLRYLVWGASNKKHLFGSEIGQPQKDEFLLELLRYVPQVLQKIDQFQELGDPIIEKKDELLDILERLKQIKSEVKDKCNQVEDEIDDIRDILNPTQCLYLLMIINKKRFAKDINFLSVNQDNDLELMQIGPRKRTKIND